MRSSIRLASAVCVCFFPVLQTFRGVRLVETVKPSEKAGTGRLSARAATTGRGADGPAPDEDDSDVSLAGFFLTP